MPYADTVRALVRTVNAGEMYAYLREYRVYQARTRKTPLGDREFQVRALLDGRWVTCCPSEIRLERS